MKIDQTKLKMLLKYNPDTGWFTWKIDTPKKAYGSRAGWDYKDRTVRIIEIEGRKYFEQILAWLYMTGNYPSKPLTHINGNYKDNRWSNIKIKRTFTNTEHKRINYHINKLLNV